MIAPGTLRPIAGILASAIAVIITLGALDASNEPDQIDVIRL